MAYWSETPEGRQYDEWREAVRTRSIVTQVSAKIAADLVVAAHKSDDTSLDELVGHFVNTTDLVNQAITAAGAEAMLKAVMPGTRVLEVGVEDNVVQFPRQEAAAVPGTVSNLVSAPQPAPIPGAADGDPETAELWKEFFTNKNNFWDNRADKRSPGSPDFAHKTKKNAKGFAAGLYLPENDKFKKNPSWVASNLAGTF